VASNERIDACTMAGDDEIEQWTTERTKDDEVGMDTTTNHRQVSGEGQQQLTKRAYNEPVVGAFNNQKGRWKVMAQRQRKERGGQQQHRIVVVSIVLGRAALHRHEPAPPQCCT